MRNVATSQDGFSFINVLVGIVSGGLFAGIAMLLMDSILTSGKVLVFYGTLMTFISVMTFNMRLKLGELPSNANLSVREQERLVKIIRSRTKVLNRLLCYHLTTTVLILGTAFINGADVYGQVFLILTAAMLGISISSLFMLWASYTEYEDFKFKMDMRATKDKEAERQLSKLTGDD
ncbi:MAG: hypothetical protein ABIL58_20165 [Pseudomonadota bacterium]